VSSLSFGFLSSDSARAAHDLAVGSQLEPGATASVSFGEVFFLHFAQFPNFSPVLAS